VEVKDLKKHFPLQGGRKVVHAVDGVSFCIQRKETLALVGESGCGKTTLGKMILGLLRPTSGLVMFNNRDIFSLKRKEVRGLRCQIQSIFQEPTASLNPRKNVLSILSQPYKLEHFGGDQIKDKVFQLLGTVGLTPPLSYIDRLPHQLSGGQKQRINIARAIALRPSFIIADEPVSSLDISVRAQILNLLKNLKDELGLTCLFITHDLAVVRSTCDRVAVMYLGKIHETGSVDRIFNSPQHPYTKSLLSATPIPNPKASRERKKLIMEGEPPSLIDSPVGCRFVSRCPLKRSACDVIEPALSEIENDHFVACHAVCKS
jgi:oligopeptide/dipeptide ABC transporter ATP-binding protein